MPPTMRFLLLSLASLCLVLTGCQTKPVASAPQISLRPIKPRPVLFKGNYLSNNSVDKPSYPLEGPGAVYPYELRKAGVEGFAVIGVAINSKGVAEQADIGSATDERLGETARAAMLQWKFSPAIKDGKPVPSWGIQRVNFILGNRSYTGNLVKHP